MAENHQRLVDEIIFLAGLATNVAMIDPLLDVVRGITATRQPGETLTLTPEEHTSLLGVRAEIEDHLLHKDALRTFTKETLHDMIEDQLYDTQPGHASPRKRSRNQFKLILKIISSVFLVTAPLFLALSISYWWILAASCTVTAMFISSCWLFLAGYATFTPALRKAYAWICAGVVLLGLSASLWMLFTSVAKIHAIPVLHYGLNYFLFGVAFFTTYIGVRTFAQAQGIRSLLTSLWFVVPSSALVAFLVTLLPHVSTVEDRYLDSTMVGVALISFYGLAIALLANRLRKTLTPGYARAISRFGEGYALSACVGIVCAEVLLRTGTGFSVRLVIMGMFYASGGVLVFISGYLFRLSSAGQSGETNQPTPTSASSNG